jgi:hypothetical protein
MKNTHRVNRSIGTKQAVKQARNGAAAEGEGALPPEDRVLSPKVLLKVAGAPAAERRELAACLEQWTRELHQSIDIMEGVNREPTPEAKCLALCEAANGLDRHVARAAGLLTLIGGRLGQAAVDYKFPSIPSKEADALDALADDVAKALPEISRSLWDAARPVMALARASAQPMVEGGGK